MQHQTKGLRQRKLRIAIASIIGMPSCSKYRSLLVAGDINAGTYTNYEFTAAPTIMTIDCTFYSLKFVRHGLLRTGCGGAQFLFRNYI